MNNELLWQEMAVLQIIGKHIYLSRHSEVKGPNGGNEAWHDEGNDQTLEHVQEQFARIAHIAGRQKSYKLLFMYDGNYLACLDV